MLGSSFRCIRENSRGCVVTWVVEGRDRSELLLKHAVDLIELIGEGRLSGICGYLSL
jgi:hypothetical protein